MWCRRRIEREPTSNARASNRRHRAYEHMTSGDGQQKKIRVWESDGYTVGSTRPVFVFGLSDRSAACCLVLLDVRVLQS